jgi:hypothetical protein
LEKLRFITSTGRKGGLLLAAFLLCLSIGFFIVTKNKQPMNATKSVQGKVFNAATGTPVEGAMIMIAEGTHEHPDIASQSDEQGTFYLPALTVPGTYTLLIHHNDQSKTVRINITSDSLLKIPL